MSTDRIKLVDLPTRMDMRDVVVTLLRPASSTAWNKDVFDQADIIVVGQLADFSNMIRTSTDGNSVRFLHSPVYSKGIAPRSEMTFTKRDHTIASEDTSAHTMDSLMRMHAHSTPMSFHRPNGSNNRMNLLLHELFRVHGKQNKRTV